MRTASKTLRSIGDLVAAGLVAREHAPALDAVAQRYAIAVTPAMADLITDAADPIGRQFLPDARELQITADERADPIGDVRHSPVPGIVHRYPDRALLKLTGLCPVYCRFCFRREMVGPDLGHELNGAELDRALAYIARTPALWEIIVTGGDPLILSPRRIGEVARRLADIPHVAVVRWHTRVPVVDPARVTAELVAALRSGPRATYVGIHANHAREFTPAAREAVARLADAGLVLVSQTVLLRGVNDDADTLADLMRTFVANRIKPYYLHHPDLAPGTSQFRLTIAEGQAIVAALRGRISGLAQPTYILDIPGGEGKVPIGRSHAAADTDDDKSGSQTNTVIVTDLNGRKHRYASTQYGPGNGTEEKA